MSSRLTAKHDVKGLVNQKAEDTRKMKKQGKIKSDHEDLSRKMKNLELCHCKPNKLLTSSLDYVNQCEQCKEYTIKQRICTEMNTVNPMGSAEKSMGCCNEERAMLKLKNVYHRCKDKKQCNEVEEIVDSSMELYDRTYFPHSRMDSNSMQRHECSKNKCQRHKRKWAGKHSNYLTLKHNGRLIEDFLEDTKENIQIKDGKTVADNESNSKKDIMNTINSTEQKVEGGLPRKEDEKAVSSNSSPSCIKNYVDMQKNYEIGRNIGDGNFAVVKECRLRKTNEEYAMKIIDKAKLIGKEDIVKNEVSIITMLSHPNIVKLIDNFETDNEIYLILEYIKGGDLFDAITESIKFTEHDAALMMTDMCKALVYIHSKNIVHRDLKPENLLVQQNPDGSATLKLADFGLAVYVTEPIFTVCGTPTYVAPEILSEKGYGLEVDMWATGVILYILLSGFPPFRSPERNHEELFQIIQRGEYEFLSPYWDNISEEAKDLISRLLALNPKKRFTARCVLQHNWIRTSGQMNSHNLQREVSMNIGRHFRSHT
uniref:non-specific serine/threonine protein kinase n=2 Tax=Pyxicephalus adspersus TaxID=30357 RepID=A0AAV3AQ35_PYXAD|nr:TPA: hypothetical protein GDO54_012384 [Pyxicephalus adspersus]